MLARDAVSVGTKWPMLGGGERVAGRSSVDADRGPLARAIDHELPGMAGRAADVEHVVPQLRIETPGEADRELIGIGRGAIGVHDEPVRAQVRGIGEPFPAPGGFSRWTGRSGRRSLSDVPCGV